MAAANSTSLRERFESKYSIDPGTGCWRWTACIGPEGYGHIGIGRRAALAHRVSYELHVGPIPEGLTIDHLCRNRACVNPAHLEPVARGENGHPFDAENTRHRKGSRECKICVRAYKKAAGKARRKRDGEV